MRLATFRRKGDGSGSERAGLVSGGKVRELEGAATVEEALIGFSQGRAPSARGASVGLDEVTLLQPVRSPGKIVAAIVNTRAMLGGDLTLDRPRLDMKAASAVIGPGETVFAPASGIRPEVELAAVVGRRMTRASPEEARGSIFGYTILNDVTAPQDSRDDAYEAFRRDPKSGEIRKATMRGPLFRSKNHDTFCPMGPWIVTEDEIGDLRSLEMSTRCDGALVQKGSTAEYIFPPEKLASYISGFLTLEPGDVVSCGSVGWSPEALGKLDPTEYVLPRAAGRMRLEIAGVGILENPVDRATSGEGSTSQR